MTDAGNLPSSPHGKSSFIMSSPKHEVAGAGAASSLVDAAKPPTRIYRSFEHFAVPELKMRRIQEGAYGIGKLKVSYCSTVGFSTETFALVTYLTT